MPFVEQGGVRLAVVDMSMARALCFALDLYDEAREFLGIRIRLRLGRHIERTKFPSISTTALLTPIPLLNKCEG